MLEISAPLVVYFYFLCWEMGVAAIVFFFFFFFFAFIALIVIINAVFC